MTIYHVDHVCSYDNAVNFTYMTLNVEHPLENNNSFSLAQNAKCISVISLKNQKTRHFNIVPPTLWLPSICVYLLTCYIYFIWLFTSLYTYIWCNNVYLVLKIKLLNTISIQLRANYEGAYRFSYATMLHIKVIITAYIYYINYTFYFQMFIGVIHLLSHHTMELL